MGNKLHFNYSREGALYVYHYLNTGKEKLIQRAFPDKIDQDWWKNWDYRPHNLYNVSGNSPAQNAVYMAIAWKLTSGFHQLGIPHWTRDDSSEEIRKAFDFIKWEYSAADQKRAWVIKNPGFIRASSSAGPVKLGKKTVFLDKWKFQRRRLAGLFKLNSFQEFIGIQKPSLTQAYSEMNYFGISDEGRLPKIIKTLNSVFRPKLAQVLGSTDIFIDVYVGLDLGYPDSILIKSMTDIGPRVDALTKEYQLSIGRYETRMTEIYAMDDFTNAIAELVNL
jgi:hypothetical protein